MKNEDNTSGDDFLIADFQQLYEQYRQGEQSRIRYIELYVILIGAFLSFSAYIIQLSDIPIGESSQAIIIFGIFAVVSFFLIWVGSSFFEASLFTRVSQYEIAHYLRKLREDFGSRYKRPVTNYAKLAIHIDEKWYDGKIPAIRLLLLLAALTSISLSLFVYTISRIIIIVIQTTVPSIDNFFETLYITLKLEKISENLINVENIISLIVGVMSLVISYFFFFSRRLRNTLKTKQNESCDKINKIENDMIKNLRNRYPLCARENF